MNLADALVPKHFDDGEQIIKQGDQADGMYFVEKGVVRITILDESGHEVEVMTFEVEIYHSTAKKSYCKQLFSFLFR